MVWTFTPPFYRSTSNDAALIDIIALKNILCLTSIA